MFLDPHLTTYFSNIGVHICEVLDLYMHMFLVQLTYVIRNLSYITRRYADLPEW